MTPDKVLMGGVGCTACTPCTVQYTACDWPHSLGAVLAACCAPKVLSNAMSRVFRLEELLS
jgi:hypothetical protein